MSQVVQLIRQVVRELAGYMDQLVPQVRVHKLHALRSFIFLRDVPKKTCIKIHLQRKALFPQIRRFQPSTWFRKTTDWIWNCRIWGDMAFLCKWILKQRFFWDTLYIVNHSKTYLFCICPNNDVDGRVWRPRVSRKKDKVWDEKFGPKFGISGSGIPKDDISGRCRGA